MNFNKYIGKESIKVRCIKKVPDWLTIDKYYTLLLISNTITKILDHDGIGDVSCGTEFLNEYFTIDKPVLSINIKVL